MPTRRIFKRLIRARVRRNTGHRFVRKGRVSRKVKAKKQWPIKYRGRRVRRVKKRLVEYSKSTCAPKRIVKIKIQALQKIVQSSGWGLTGIECYRSTWCY